MINYLKSVSAVALLFVAGASNATIFQYEDTNANNGGPIGDKLSSVTGTFNDVSERFTWNVNFNSNPTDVNGFWLVVNNGPNPKQSNVNELAIIYGDLTTGIASTYAYNGQNNANSINSPGLLLATHTFNTTSDSFTLDIDATAINDWSAPETAPDYAGISFGSHIGVWMHIATGSTFGYNTARDTITDFSFAHQGWYDNSWRTTTQVPEPGSLVLLGLGLLGLSFARKRQS